ncbi:MAG: LysM peptidoglycan-binding domain-containing protein [Chthoniobacteraceae bacterium]
MSFRVPILRAAAFSLAALSFSPAKAQDIAGDVRALRQTVEQQAKQIEALSAQVARLAEKIEGHANTAPPAGERVAPAPADSADFAIPAARVVPPHPPANVHIVVKGESLEKIAKSHGITTAELQKLNRITDPKKLQIGQQLQLPPPTPKKEAQ